MEVTLNITKISITLKRRNKLRGFAEMILENSFIIKGIKIIESDKGYFIEMHIKKKANNKIINMVHPKNNETRLYIEDAILDKYEEEINK